ncbi:hypothetical protein LDHU3_34.6030:CDS1 [Leishmania donovani]|nr:hypothetical protein LDHU3_34.6030:CDS1 [Leishmania donovani]
MPGPLGAQQAQGHLLGVPGDWSQRFRGDFGCA